MNKTAYNIVLYNNIGKQKGGRMNEKETLKKHSFNYCCLNNMCKKGLKNKEVKKMKLNKEQITILEKKRESLLYDIDYHTKVVVKAKLELRIIEESLKRQEQTIKK